MEFKSYEYKSAGKLLGMTKIRHMWKLKVNGQYYDVKLAESLISGKFVVMVQNDIVYNEKVDSGAKKRGISVSADGLDLMFKTAAKGMDLYVNMVKFQANSSGGSAVDDDFAAYESTAYKGGSKATKKAEEPSRARNDHMEGSWAQFDAMDSSDEDQSPFDNFETRGNKPSKGNADPFGKGGADRDAFGTAPTGGAPKFGSMAKPTDQKAMGLKFKSGVGANKGAPMGGNKDPFGGRGKDDDEDGWGAPATSKGNNQAGGWAQVGGNDDDDDDNDGFLNFGTAPTQPNKQNFLSNIQPKAQGGNPPRSGSGVGFDVGFGQSSSNDPFGNPGGNRTPTGPNRGSGFDAFGGAGSNQSQNKGFAQPQQTKPADPFGGWGKAPNAPQQPSGSFDAFGAPVQAKPPAPQGNNMWSNFNVNKNPAPQNNQFGQQPPQNAFGGQSWGAQKAQAPVSPQPFGNPQQGFNAPQQGFGGPQPQQRPPQPPQPQQGGQANMWKNFGPNAGFGAPPNPQQQQQQQPRPPMPNQPPQNRPPQQQQAQQGQWAQQQAPNPFGAPPQQPQQQNPFGAPINPQNPFGGPAQPQQRPPAPPAPQPSQQGNFQAQQPQGFQNQAQGFANAPVHVPQQAPSTPDNVFGAPQTNWDAGFGQPMEQASHQQPSDAQATIEHNPFNNFAQEQPQGGDMYPKPDLTQFGGAPEEPHHDHQSPQAQHHDNLAFDAHQPQHTDAQNVFEVHQQPSDPFNGHSAEHQPADPFAHHADPAQVQNLNDQMGGLTFNAAPDAQHQPAEQ